MEVVNTEEENFHIRGWIKQIGRGIQSSHIRFINIYQYFQFKQQQKVFVQYQRSF